jgi:trimeric autotransporter adhesin
MCRVVLISRAAMAAGALLFSLVFFAPAQTFVGGVRGLVQDSTGAVMSGATITLRDDATAVARTTVSNSAGEYVFSQLPPATYTLSAEIAGFKKLERRRLVVATQEILTVDLKMELGQITESVQVTTEAPLIESATASNGQVINSQQINDLPNLGRNVYLMSKLSNNVVPVGDPRWNRFQDQIGSSAVAIAGGPIRGNNYTIDGIAITTSQNLPEAIPTMEGVQEMKTQTGTYDATMGRTGGGVFNTVLRTGSNDIHADVFGYLRETDWSANTFYNNAAGLPRAGDDWKNFGGSVGGPVVIPKVYNGKNKTFFFVAQEAYREHQPYSVQYALPTAAEREQGDFSQAGLVIYNPLSTRACVASDNCPAGVTSVRTPFGGNTIPASMINPVAAAMLSPQYIPLPQVNNAKTVETNDFTGTDSLFNRADEYIYKVEESPVQWLRIAGSFLYYKSREPGGNPLGTIAGSSGSYLLYRHVDATAVNAIITANPTTVVSLRYGFNRFPNIYNAVSSGFDPSLLGFPASYANSLTVKQFPGLVLSNAGSSIGYNGTQNVNYWSKNVSAGVSKFKGKHSLQAGWDFRTINAGGLAYTSPAGIYTFNGVFSQQYPTKTNGTGSDWADMLMGFPSAGTLQTTTPLFFGVHYNGLYFQDDIRWTSRFTMNFGVRYEYESGIQERNNHMLVGFNTAAVNPIAANLPPGSGVNPLGVMEFAGQNGNPTHSGNPLTDKFGPRIGLAYQLNSKTTVRAGWGIFYAPTFFGVDAATSPGYVQTNTYVASNNGNQTPANSLSNPFPQGILQPAGNSLGALTAIGSNFTFVDQNRTSGIVNQFSADVQRELPMGIALEVGYIGSRSHHLLPASTAAAALFINQVPTQDLSLGSALTQSVTNPFYGLPGAAGVVANPTVARAQLLLPYPQYSAVTENTNPVHAQYDSMVVKLQKRLSKGLTFLSTFTWSKNLDNAWGSAGSNYFNTFAGSTPASEPQNAYNLAAEWALASADVPLRFTTSWTYQLPFGKNGSFLTNNKVIDYLVGGWSINGLTIFQNGFPLFIYQTNQNSVIGAGEQRPNATGTSPSMSGSPESLQNNYINPAAFSLAPAFTFGNASRNIGYRGPGEANWDLSIFKDFTIKERYKAQFRAEALNAFNTPLFANPNTLFQGANATGQAIGNFGHLVYQTNTPRELQLGIRFLF